MKRLKVVVSDFHLGKGKKHRDGTINVLEDFTYDREFIEFLQYYSHPRFGDSEVELIINGDFLNLLQMDYFGMHTYLVTEDIVEHQLKKIMSGHSDLFMALKSFANTPKHKITMVVGNHDSGLLFGRPRRMLIDFLGAPIKFIDDYYQFHGIHIEHGHRFESFAYIKPYRALLIRDLPEPVLRMPLGSLFVATVLPKIKLMRSWVDKVKPLNVFLIWTMVFSPILTTKALIMIFRFFLNTASRRKYNYLSFTTTMQTLKEISIYPIFESEAVRIFNKNPSIHAVVLGHTHITKYRQWREGREYINSGTWNEITSLEIGSLGTHLHLNYVLIEYETDSESIPIERPRIVLKEWFGERKVEKDSLL